MEFSFGKLKNILNTKKDNQLAGSGSLEPEIGFKLALHPVAKTLYVTVIGARHLPSLFGLSRAHGYLAKVKMFPGDSKFETTLQESSWPIWNEDFKFQLKQKDTKDQKNDLQNLVAGHFLSLTIYALLEPAKQESDKRKGKTLDSKSKSKVSSQDEPKIKGGFLEKTFSSFKSTKAEAAAQKSVLEKRRTLGAATWNFDSKLFQNDLKNGLIGTPDIWRPINAIASGLSSTDSRRENKKGQLEVTLLYTTSENGLNDVVQLTINRLRCSVQTMQEHEQFRAPLYLKATILEANKAECYWKSDRFDPTISAKWDPKSATVKLTVFKANLDKRENKKGQLEVTLLYTTSENGLNDVVQLTINRLRCSVQTMQEHEQFRAPLYLKATILEANKAECYWKSDRFDPTISAKWDPKSATVKLTVFKANLDKVSIYISLGCKLKMGKKEILGKASIDEKSPSAESWNECLKKPGVPKTFWVNFD